MVSNSTKAIILTSYMKMLKNCPALKPNVVTVLEQYKDHWDEELQQRACEYLTMIERASQDPNVSQLVMNSLERIPNFSEELQTNNVLTRRILQLKVQKGFAIN
jgi:AP-2 complex subunit alpha